MLILYPHLVSLNMGREHRKQYWGTPHTNLQLKGQVRVHDKDRPEAGKTLSFPAHLTPQSGS